MLALAPCPVDTQIAMIKYSGILISMTLSFVILGNFIFVYRNEHCFEYKLQI